MKNLKYYDLSISDIKVLEYEKFIDNRGYFTEHFREDDLKNLEFLKNFKIVQSNESFSKKNTLRGLHFQWNPNMGKLVRVVNGHMIDLIADIRIGSPTYGHIIGVELKHNPESEKNQWVWIPPGFAHGCLFLEDSTIEYYCTGQYSNGQEASISPLAKDLKWELCDKNIKKLFDSIIFVNNSFFNNSFFNNIINPDILITDKDLNGYSLSDWVDKNESLNFIYNNIDCNVLVTGGSGLLGNELKKHLLNALFPESNIFNLLNLEQMEKYIKNFNIHTILHCAAYTPPQEVQKNPIKALDTNIIGTSNLVKLCEKYDIKLIYISTDYVFDGLKGNYCESDPVNPVNTYAWTKLGGECAVKCLNNHIIVRLSFGPNVFPYANAFIDQFTSRESVTLISKKIIKLITKHNFKGTVHIGSNRKSVYDYAINLGGYNIGKISIDSLNTKVPKDTSLNTNLFDSL